MKKDNDVICIRSRKNIGISKRYLLILVIPYIIGTSAISVIWLLFVQLNLYGYMVVILIGTSTYFGLWAIAHISNGLLINKYKVCYDFNNKEVFFVKIKDNKIKLKIPLDYINEIIITPKERKTNIVASKPISVFTGVCVAIYSDDMEFSFILCEDFKKYWENHTVSV